MVAANSRGELPIASKPCAHHGQNVVSIEA